jgi:hypothetical protein
MLEETEPVTETEEESDDAPRQRLPVDGVDDDDDDRDNRR